MDGSSAIFAHTIAEEPAEEDGSGRKKTLSKEVLLWCDEVYISKEYESWKNICVV